MKIVSVNRDESYACRPLRASWGWEGRVSTYRSVRRWQLNNLHQWAITGERRAYTDTDNCGDPFTDWTLPRKGGEHVNTYYGRS